MKKQSIETIKKLLEKKGHKFFDNGKPYNVNLIGIRNEKNVDQFNDFLHLIYRLPNEQFRNHCFPITTDPGLYWMKNFEHFNPYGVFILKEGQYRGAFEIDWFNGRYKALCQKGKLKGYRDGNKDDFLDFDPSTIVEGEHFQICFHKEWPYDKKGIVGISSAGCQVFKENKDFEEFMKIISISVELFGPKISYTLLNGKDFK